MRAIPESVSRITHQLSARILHPEDSEDLRNKDKNGNT